MHINISFSWASSYLGGSPPVNPFLNSSFFLVEPIANLIPPSGWPYVLMKRIHALKHSSHLFSQIQFNLQQQMVGIDVRPHGPPRRVHFVLLPPWEAHQLGGSSSCFCYSSALLTINTCIIIRYDAVGLSKVGMWCFSSVRGTHFESSNER